MQQLKKSRAIHLSIHLTPNCEEVLRKLSLLHRTELYSSGPELVRTLNLVLNVDGNLSCGSKQTDAQASGYQ